MGIYWHKTTLVTVLSVLLVGIAVSGCTPSSPSPPSGPSAPTSALAPTPSSTATQMTKTHVYTDGRIEVRGSGEPVELINNPNATNPTFAELVAFIERDRTDEYSYIFGPPKNAFVCSDFAETVHNNAEAAGIKAAWVGIDIEGEPEGHALNAFETTDLGLVYIDCTGKGLWDESPNRSSWDRRVRVDIGKPYAVADIDKAKTLFKFLISEPNDADRKYKLGDPQFNPFVSDKQVLGRLEELGWIRADTFGPILASQKRMQKDYEMLQWSRTHNIEELGLKWMQEWIREHEVELYGRDFEPGKYGENKEYITSTEQWVSNTSWYILVDCLDTSWFEPVETLIDVDGIPIVWKIRWEMVNSWYINAELVIEWYKPFGNKVIKDIHIHWGE